MSQDFTCQCRVYYEDTDAAGVVYYANYLKYAERARSEYLRQVFAAPSVIAKNLGVMFVVRQCHVDYLRPAYLDDLLNVFTKIIIVKSATVEMQQRIMREEQILVEVKVILACVDYPQFQVSRIPHELRARLACAGGS